MVLGHGRRLTLTGIVAGIAGAFAVSKLVQQTLFEVDATNPLVYLDCRCFCWLVTEWLRGRRLCVREDRSGDRAPGRVNHDRPRIAATSTCVGPKEK